MGWAKDTEQEPVANDPRTPTRSLLRCALQRTAQAARAEGHASLAGMGE